MIIALTPDSETTIGSRYLSHLYHEHILQAVEFFDSTRDKSDLAVDQRLTFLSHSKTMADSEGKVEVLYGGLTATEFVNRFTAVMSPDQAKHISHIDFIGCNIGHVDAEGHGFVMDVVRQLQEQGYQMSISTFMSAQHDYDSLVVNCCPIDQNGLQANIWRLLGLKTAQDSQSAGVLSKKLRGIARDKQILHTELSHLQSAPSPANVASQPPKNAARLMMMRAPQHNPLFSGGRKAQITDELKALGKLEITTARQLQALYVVLCLTDNPRTLFNSSPEIYNAGNRLKQWSSQQREPEDTDTERDSETWHES